MTIQQIYKLAIQMGIKADLRGKEKVNKYLARVKDKYIKMPKEAKNDFDLDRLFNPYSDTRILTLPENPNKIIKKILVGIDIDTAEILLADRLGDIDLIISHHPRGRGLANLSDVMELQAEVIHQYGVPINIAEKLLKLRISEVSRSLSSANHNRAVDTACLLGYGFMCTHTIADNLVANFLDKIISKENPEYVDELMALLKKIPEYKEAISIGAGPSLFVGSEDNRCGKIALSEITGGTEGSPRIYEKMAQAGIGTIVGMHVSEEHKKQAEAAHINVVIAGHISSDSIGMNIFLDSLKKKGIKIIPCSGLIRKG